MVGVLGEGSSILGGEKVGRDVVGVLGEGSSILGGEKVGRDVGGVCWDIEKWKCVYGRRKSKRLFFHLRVREGGGEICPMQRELSVEV